MSGQPQEDPLDGRRDRATPARLSVAGADGQTQSDNDQSLGDREQTLADADQTSSDSDQTLADADQTSSDSDQTSADLDQLAADRDQAASDRDLAAGASATTHDASRDIRERSAADRDENAEDRLQVATDRDAHANTRDLAARARDEAADARDQAMAQLDGADEHDDDVRAVTGAEVVLRAAERRRRAAQYRAHAAEQRVQAAYARRAAGEDREQAARDRAAALKDREALAHQLAITETDPLTGARARAAGLRELDHELDRAARTATLVVVAYVDVVGLKTLNDSQGHSSGDALLKRVVTTIRDRLRTYDLVIRLGGDEFLCAMPNMNVIDARRRFAEIAAALAAAPEGGAFRTGFAEVKPAETASDLIARADAELISSRSR